MKNQYCPGDIVVVRQNNVMFSTYDDFGVLRCGGSIVRGKLFIVVEIFNNGNLKILTQHGLFYIYKIDVEMFSSLSSKET